jgi:mono/diheme cytochrome c family protein
VTARSAFLCRIGVCGILCLFTGLISPARAGTNGLVEIPDTLHGHFVYKRNCSVCHGRRGDGNGEMGLTVIPRPRDFGLGVFKYRSTPSGYLPTDEDLARTIRHGIADTAMPVFNGLPERDLKAVIGYIKTFSPRWRDVKNYAPAIPIPLRPSWFADASQLQVRAAQAQPLYETACAPCHGAKGDGVGPVTNLVNTAGHPTPARDLRLPYLRSGKLPEDTYRVLLTGLDGTPMPAFAEGFTDEQRWELVAFIEVLRRDYARKKPGEQDHRERHR